MHFDNYTSFINLQLYTNTVDFQAIKMWLECRLSALFKHFYTNYYINSLWIRAVFIHTKIPIFRGTKLIGLVRIILNMGIVFNTWMKSVNDCLKTRIFLFLLPNAHSSFEIFYQPFTACLGVSLCIQFYI